MLLTGGVTNGNVSILIDLHMGSSPPTDSPVWSIYHLTSYPGQGSGVEEGGGVLEHSQGYKGHRAGVHRGWDASPSQGTCTGKLEMQVYLTACLGRKCSHWHKAKKWKKNQTKIWLLEENMLKDYMNYIIIRSLYCTGSHSVLVLVVSRTWLQKWLPVIGWTVTQTQTIIMPLTHSESMTGKTSFPCLTLLVRYKQGPWPRARLLCVKGLQYSV